MAAAKKECMLECTFEPKSCCSFSEAAPNTCPIETSCSQELEIMEGLRGLQDSISQSTQSIEKLSKEQEVAINDLKTNRKLIDSFADLKATYEKNDYAYEINDKYNKVLKQFLGRQTA